MQKIEPKKVVTLGTGEKYLVIAHTTKDDKDYYYIAETNLYEDDNIYLDEVIGENNLKEILRLFIK